MGNLFGSAPVGRTRLDLGQVDDPCAWNATSGTVAGHSHKVEREKSHNNLKKQKVITETSPEDCKTAKTLDG